MDYEKYNNALEKARLRYNEIKDTNCSEEKFLLDLFPELKESEDERIRKGIIDFLWKEKIFLQEAHSSVENNPKYRFVMDAIAWLEKQGEQKAIMNVPTREVILFIWDLGNEWKELTNGSISTKYGTQLDYIQKHWHESEYYLREKQGKKKATDKVEPKFHEGDFVVSKITNTTYQIESVVLNVTNNKYGYDLTNGGYIASIEAYKYHLWTIQDAKDGDVLVYNNGTTEIILLFKKWMDGVGEGAYSYVHIFDDGNEILFNDYSDCGKNAHPATKEQRDLLFKKIKEAGYEWDAEKEELKLLISNGGDFESDDSEQESKEEIKTTAYGTFGNNGAIEYVYILDYCSGRVIVAKHDTEESIETLFDRLGLKESQCQYMVSTDILSIEYINF